MNITEAIKAISEEIPEPGSKMIDTYHMKFVWAWWEFIREFHRVEQEKKKHESEVEKNENRT